MSAHAAAADLLRTALTAKLAVNVGDPVLSRRASLQAAGHARLLAGLDVEARAAVVEPSASLAELLAFAYPAASVLELDVPPAVVA